MITLQSHSNLVLMHALTCTRAQAAANVADINLDIHVDTVTANKIRELARAKDTAVANEDYDEAKRLKASIDRLKVRACVCCCLGALAKMLMQCGAACCASKWGAQTACC